MVHEMHPTRTDDHPGIRRVRFTHHSTRYIMRNMYHSAPPTRTRVFRLTVSRVDGLVSSSVRSTSTARPSACGMRSTRKAGHVFSNGLGNKIPATHAAAVHIQRHRNALHQAAVVEVKDDRVVPVFIDTCRPRHHRSCLRHRSCHRRHHRRRPPRTGRCHRSVS